MRCLVTGAAGFLGTALCRRLAADGHELVLLVRSQDPLPAEFPPARVVVGDILDPKSIQEAVAGVQVVFHLAAIIAYQPAMRDIMFKVNVEGSINVAKACLKEGCRMVHVSSMATIGFNWSADDPPRTEESQYNLGGYGLSYCESKLEAERALFALDGLDVVVVNPGNIYGPRDTLKASRTTQVKIALGRFPFYTKGGNNIVHVDDVADGLVRAWQQGRRGQRYILGGDNLPVRTMFALIATLARAPAPWIALPVWAQMLAGRLGMVPLEKVLPANMFCYFSSEKAERELGYRHRPGSDALRDSVLWMLGNIEALKVTGLPRSSKILVAVSAAAFFVGIIAIRHIFAH